MESRKYSNVWCTYEVPITDTSRIVTSDILAPFHRDRQQACGPSYRRAARKDELVLQLPIVATNLHRVAVDPLDMSVNAVGDLMRHEVAQVAAIHRGDAVELIVLGVNQRIACADMFRRSVQVNAVPSGGVDCNDLEVGRVLERLLIHAHERGEKRIRSSKPLVKLSASLVRIGIDLYLEVISETLMVAAERPVELGMKHAITR